MNKKYFTTTDMIGLTELKNAETTFTFLYYLQKTLGTKIRAGFRKPALKKLDVLTEFLNSL